MLGFVGWAEGVLVGVLDVREDTLVGVRLAMGVLKSLLVGIFESGAFVDVDKVVIDNE